MQLLRCVSRKGKRKHEGGGGGGGGGRHAQARNFNPPSLHALALVGSRLNQSVCVPGGSSVSPYHRSSAASSSAWSRTAADYDDDYDYDDYEHGDQYDDDEVTTTHEQQGGGANQLTLLEQLCTVVENEHTAAAEALSAFGAC